jgi:hypothetical protein
MGRIAFKHNQVYVFGSNLAGIHGAGSAMYARKHFGAIRGIGEGLQGHAYGIPTKDKRFKTLPLNAIKEHVLKFISYATAHPELEFIIVPIGCGLAGYTPYDIAPMFENCPANCKLPQDFINVLDSKY